MHNTETHDCACAAGNASRTETEEDGLARSFDSFFPNFDPETEKLLMDKANETVEDDLDGDFWRTALKLHLGRDVMENAEIECVKAACKGQTALADVLEDEVNRQKEQDAKIAEDPDVDIPEMQVYLNIAAGVDGARPSREWADAVKESVSDSLEKTVLSGQEERSGSLEEAYVKAVSRNDKNRMAVIDYVKSIRN